MKKIDYNKEYKKYIDTIVENHLYQINTILKNQEEYNIDQRSKKERAVDIMVQSAVWQHACYLAEAKRISEVIFQKELKLEDHIEELIDTCKKLQVVARAGKLETSNGVPIEEILETLRGVNETEE